MLEQTLDLATKDGAMETFICHPERGGPYPPVLLLMDLLGLCYTHSGLTTSAIAIDSPPRITKASGHIACCN